MEWIFIPVGVFFVLAGAACMLLVVLGLPGAWLILALAGLIELADALYLPPGDRQTFSWWVLGVCAAILILGDLLEWITSALGVKMGGGTKRGMWGALIGGFAGFLLLTPLFWFVPVVGSLLGALAGTFIGAYIGEVSGAQPRSGIKPAAGATIGRVLGTVAKVGTGLVVWLTLSVAALWP